MASDDQYYPRFLRQQHKGNEILDNLQPHLYQQQIIGHNASGQKVNISLEDEIASKVSIYHGSIIDDILTNNVDAVVNPANERLWSTGSGVCGTIFQEAGYDKLQKACHDITQQIQGNQVPTGQAVITPAFKLKTIKHIVHTVAPSQQNNEDLISCYLSALELCVIAGISSVVFPCVATGDANFSKQAASSIALRAVRGWLVDAKAIKYKDFIKKYQLKRWHCNIQTEMKQLQDEDIFVDEDESVCDRVQEVVFCCFDSENWNLYQQNISKIYPCSDHKRSFLWSDKLRAIEYENELLNMRQRIELLEMENKKLKRSDTNDINHEDGIDDKDNCIELKEKEKEKEEEQEDKSNVDVCDKMCNELKAQIMCLKEQYSEQELDKIIKTSPQKLIGTHQDMMKSLDYLNKIKVIIDDGIKFMTEQKSMVTQHTVPDVQRYEEWNANEIMLYIMSLDDGKFTSYIDQIRAGLIASEINGALLPELTRPDLSVPPFSINSFKVKKELINHFQALKKTRNKEGDDTDHDNDDEEDDEDDENDNHTTMQ